MSSLQVSDTGTYTFACRGGEVSVVPGGTFDDAGRIFGGMFAGIAAIVVGILLAVFGALWRRRRGV